MGLSIIVDISVQGYLRDCPRRDITRLLQQKQSIAAYNFYMILEINKITGCQNRSFFSCSFRSVLSTFWVSSKGSGPQSFDEPGDSFHPARYEANRKSLRIRLSEEDIDKICHYDTLSEKVDMLEALGLTHHTA